MNERERRVASVEKCELRKWENYEWWWWKSTKELQFAKSLRYSMAALLCIAFTTFPTRAYNLFSAARHQFSLSEQRIFYFVHSSAEREQTCKVLIDSDTPAQRAEFSTLALKLHSNEGLGAAKNIKIENPERNDSTKNKMFSIFSLLQSTIESLTRLLHPHHAHVRAQWERRRELAR